MRNQTLIIALIVSVIIGVSILGYGLLNYKYRMESLEKEQAFKMETLNKEKEEKEERERKLTRCKLESEMDYSDYWDAQCKVQGLNKKTEGCILPRYIATEIETRREKSLENCIKLYSSD